MRSCCAFLIRHIVIPLRTCLLDLDAWTSDLSSCLLYLALLLGLGVRDLSMAAGSLPRVKQRVRSLELTAATVRAQAIMEQADTGRIATLLDDFNGLA